MSYIHLHGLQSILHRDIKPENVVMMADGSIRLADFGLAVNLDEKALLARVGTLDYLAPEVYLLRKEYCIRVHALSLFVVQIPAQVTQIKIRFLLVLA